MALRILTKRHAEIRRFKDTGKLFRSGEEDTAFKYAERLLETEFAVQIKAESYPGTWYELRTQFNTRNALIH